MAAKKVSLVSGKSRKESVLHALNLIRDDLDPIGNAQCILLKPNLVAVKPEYANTHVETVESVIEFLNREFPGKRLVVGESSASAYYAGVKTIEVMRDYGYCALPEKFENVRLTVFSDDTDFDEVPIQSVVGDTHLRITKRHSEFDYKISISIPKTHNFAMATFGIKNMAGLVTLEDMAVIHGMKAGKEVDAPKTLLDRLPLGTVSRARRMLPKWLVNTLFRAYPTYRRSVKIIHHNIVSFARLLWPDLVILDGWVAMERDGPVSGTPVDLRAVAASADALKADALGARLIGIEPMEIGYLYYLAQEGYGDPSLEGLVGDKLEDYAKNFIRHGTYDIQSQWR